MNIFDVSNNHLLNAIDSYLNGSNNDDISQDLINEFVLSTIFYHKIKGEIEIVKTQDSRIFIPIFTDIEEYTNCYDDNNPIMCDFINLFDYVDGDVDGVIVNPKGCDFTLEMKTIDLIFDKYEKFSNKQYILKSNFTIGVLNQIRKISNTKLSDMLNNYSEHDDFFKELSKSKIFTLIESYSDASEYANRGIINIDDIQKGDLITIKQSDSNYALIFTSFDKIGQFYSDFVDSDNLYYPYIVTIEEIFKFAIKCDLDGIIFNYGNENLIFSRELIFKHLEDVVNLCGENAENGYGDYAFLFDYVMNLKGYDVKIRLDDFRPLMWRDIIIPAGITFKDLDNILKILWDFIGYHLSQFSFPNDFKVVKIPAPDIVLESNELNACDIIIDDYFERFKKIYWEYDFGDGWSFTIEIKKTVDFDVDYPIIKRYKGKYNLKDDIGGIGGLKRLINRNSDELTEFNQKHTQDSLKGYKNYVTF